MIYIVKIYTTNHFHYHRLVPLTKRTTGVIKFGDSMVKKALISNFNSVYICRSDCSANFGSDSCKVSLPNFMVCLMYCLNIYGELKQQAYNKGFSELSGLTNSSLPFARKGSDDLVSLVAFQTNAVSSLFHFFIYFANTQFILPV